MRLFVVEFCCRSNLENIDECREPINRHDSRGVRRRHRKQYSFNEQDMVSNKHAKITFYFQFQCYNFGKAKTNTRSEIIIISSRSSKGNGAFCDMSNYNGCSSSSVG